MTFWHFLMGNGLLQAALSSVPAGAWAVGVSGGADSIALLSSLREVRSSDIEVHVVHLNHEARGEQSRQDANFVQQLCARLLVPCTIALRREIEGSLPVRPSNLSAFYRALRFALFERIVQRHHLQGVILAHHADDQAETVFQRLLRGSGPAGVSGMGRDAMIGNLRITRPLLGVSSAELRMYLADRSLAWREDASNQSGKYQRNRVRKVLADHPMLSSALLDLAGACFELGAWVRHSAPQLQPEVSTSELTKMPDILAEESAKNWLVDHAGVKPEELAPPVIQRLLLMAKDAAMPARQDFPGRVRVQRRRGIISVAKNSAS